MYKVISITKKEWDGGGGSHNQFIGYFSVPKGWSLLEEAVASFVADYWNKILFHNVLGVYRPIGLGFPDNVSGLDIEVVELKEKPINIGNLIDERVREELYKIYPYNRVDRINYDVGFKEKIFGFLNTEKLSDLEEDILVDPNYNFNHIFERVWKANILLTKLIKETNIRPGWLDDYIRVMSIINNRCNIEKFRETKFKDVAYLYLKGN